MNIPVDCGCVLGIFDQLSQRVDPETGEVVDYVPPQPTENHAWDTATKRWVYVPQIPEIQSQMWEKIKAERDRRKAGGVKVGEKWFHSDDASRIQQIGLVMMGAGIPTGLQWKTMDGTFIEMTQELAGQIFQAVAAYDQEIFAIAEQHRTAMQAMEDPLAYDFSGGWPSIHGE